MIVVYARRYVPVAQPYYDGVNNPIRVPRTVASAAELATMSFADVASAGRAFSLAGRGCDVSVEDDEGVVHRHVDDTRGFSTSRVEMEMRGIDWRAS